MKNPPLPVFSPLPLLLLLLLLLCTSFAEAIRYQANGPGIQPGSGVDIEIHTLFESTPHRGFAPVRVTISNNSSGPQTWEFVFRSHEQFGSSNSLTYETALTVPQGEAKGFDLMVPLMRLNQYGSLTAEVYGHGIIPRERAIHFSQNSHYSSAGTQSAQAMSPPLWSANWGKLETDPSTGSRPASTGSVFDPALMPTDWRAYAGFDAVWITDREWMTTGATERRAVLDWVATGGQLYVCREESETSPLPDLDTPNGVEPVAHGFGSFRVWPRNGDDLDIEATAKQIRSEIPSTHQELQNSYHRSAWGLLAMLPEVAIRKGLFIGFLVLFAVVVGPVNLFVFARGSQRYRLFWTTPAISIGASLTVFLLILFQDGVGGSGHQIAVWSHFPGENKAVYLQEQASRTALLTGRGFATESPVSISPINVQNLSSNTGSHLTANPRNYGGDWFRNRSTQGHLIEGVTATRWRIEAASPPVPGTPPELLSTFPFPLDSVFYRDAQGVVWHAAGLETGVATRLEEIDESVFHDAWQAFRADAGPTAQRRMRPVGHAFLSDPGPITQAHVPGSRGHFFAFTSDQPEATLPTLESINWKTRKTLHTGPLAPSNP